MELTLSQWHDRYSQQARWTRELRDFFITQFPSPPFALALDVGCGTGALLSPGKPGYAGKIIELDLDLSHLLYSPAGVERSQRTLGDAHRLPFPDDLFDLTYCHYLFLWLADPQRAAAEMRRVTKPGGWVAAFAEPDYGGRIDHPPALEKIKPAQIQSLRQQGADPCLGRKLKSIFSRVGLKELTSGVLQGSWTAPPSEEELNLEWLILEKDLHDLLSSRELTELKEQDDQAWKAGERIVYVPTFYAWGAV